MRNLFVKGLFAASAVMMLASCNNEEGMDIQNGATTKVAVGVSVLTPESKAYTGDQLNQGATVQPINDFTIVPMVMGAYQAPIVFDDPISSNFATGNFTEARIPTSVDQFRVYGNVPADLLAAIQTNKGFTLTTVLSEENKDTQYNTLEENEGESLYTPYGLYYYADAEEFMVATSEDDWNNVTGWTSASIVGQNNRIKIEDVTYKMGVVAAGVLLADTISNNKCFDVANTAKSWEEIGKTGMDLKGLVIYGQPASMDATFAQTGEHRVFAAVAEGTDTYLEDKLDFDSNNKIAGANIYCPVAKEENGSITVSFQVQNNTGYSITLKNGAVAADGAYLYYTTTLKRDDKNNKNIFDEGYTTLLNATITDWANATTALPLEVDVQIGVIIDTQWAKGISFDQAI